MRTSENISSPKDTHTFNPDRPIRVSVEDRLGVDQFVRRLVGPLLNTPVDASLVVGLYGEWGHGKSSALNLLEAALLKTKQQIGTQLAVQAQVVRFTPWLYSSVETLLAAFFETMAVGVGGFEANNDEKKRKLSQALKGIGEFVAPAVKLGAVVLTGPVGGALAVPVVNAVADTLAGAAKGTAEAMSGGEQSFRQLKEEASEVLRSLGEQSPQQRVVVLIDDLDRAAGIDEVLAMLKLVKLVADLPNVSYVIAMDHERVQALLRERIGMSFGDDFLDKIIQIPISLPPVHQAQLSRMLIDEAVTIAMTAGLDASPLHVDWDSWDGWDILRPDDYEFLIRPALRTLRDVARVMNVFQFSALTGESRPEHHAVDLLLLCVLQVLYPGVYESIRKNRPFLLHEEPDWSAMVLGKEEKEKVRERRRARLRDIAGVPAEDAGMQQVDSVPLNILKYLFPQATEGPLEGLEAQRARNDARIRSPQRFDRYFLLQPPENEVPRRKVVEVFELLVKVGSGEHREDGIGGITQQLQKMGERARTSLYSQLNDRAAAMELEDARGLAVALVPLARVTADDTFPANVIQSLAAHTFRTLIQYRETDRETRDRDANLGLTLLLNLIDVFPPGIAAEYAGKLVKLDVFSIPLEEDGRQKLAKAGLRRSIELFASTPDIFAQLGSRSAADAIWTRLDLVRRSGEITSIADVFRPIQDYLGRLLTERPSRLSDIISLAAAWGDKPSLEMTPTGDMLGALGNLLDVEVVEKRAREMLDQGDPAGEWPYLVREFVERLDRESSGGSPGHEPVEGNVQGPTGRDPVAEDESTSSVGLV